MKKFKVKIPYGSWHMKTGAWHYNPLLKMSENEQRERNLKQGYKCE